MREDTGNSDVSHQAEMDGSCGARSVLSLVLGVLAFVPLVGFISGVLAAVVGNTVRKRFLSGRKVRRQELLLASLGVLFGLAGILFNLVLGVVVILRGISGGGTPGR